MNKRDPNRSTHFGPMFQAVTRGLRRAFVLGCSSTGTSQVS